MSYEIISHTADLKIKITADNLKSLFIEALRAMMETLSKKTKKETSVARKIFVTAPDKRDLLKN